jgi:N-sulfoglucosamine sulfohydrolase
LQLVNIASLAEYQATLEKLEKLRRVLQQWRSETADTAPSHLTGDWFDRETGKSLTIEKVRGEMPGGEQAIHTEAKGPY